MIFFLISYHNAAPTALLILYNSFISSCIRNSFLVLQSFNPSIPQILIQTISTRLSRVPPIGSNKLQCRRPAVTRYRSL
ncbi:MAG TPA: hypothetical protein DCO75_12940 [Fibrobacteres bacterium]|nr:hypothetical protein [Fibrobacterota bacterium]